MKNPFKSLTVIGILIAASANYLPIIGIQVDEAATLDFVDRATSTWPQIVEAGGLVLALIGRWKATRPLSFKKG
jgi:hypothetical protein